MLVSKGKKNTKLGRKAERIFAGWCEDANMIPNPSEIDETGWDFIVEIPLDKREEGFSFEASFRCLIQVKASNKPKGNRNIKLQNLLHMCTTELPAFYIFMQFEGKQTPQSAELIHVGENLMVRVAEAEFKGEQPDVKKQKTIKLSCDDIKNDVDCRMSSLDGDCLRKMLLDYIGEDISKYIRQKLDFIKKVGYDDCWGILQADFNEQDFLKLRDLFLGKVSSIMTSPDKASLLKRRFGMFDKNAELYNDIILEFDAVPSFARKGIVRFKREEDLLWLSFDAELYVPPFIEDLSLAKYHAFRITSQLFDFTASVNNGMHWSYYFNRDLNSRIGVKDFRDALRLWAWLNQKDVKIKGELRFDVLPKVVTIGLVGEEAYDFQKELQSLKVIEELVHQFDIREEIMISPNELTRYQSILNFVHRVQESQLRNSPIEVSVILDGDVDNISFPETGGVYLSPRIIPIGSHYLSMILKIVGDIDFDSSSKTVILKSRDFEWLEPSLRSVNESVNIEIERMITHIAKLQKELFNQQKKCVAETNELMKNSLMRVGELMSLQEIVEQ